MNSKEIAVRVWNTRPSTDMLAEALRDLLSTPAIAEEDWHNPDWGCEQTWQAIERARDALQKNADTRSAMREIEVTDDMVEQAWITYVDASMSPLISNLEAMRAVLEEAIALSKQVSVKRTLYGPHGWLVGNKLLGEESWSLENGPPENDSDHFSVPLYTVANPFTIHTRQALAAHSAGEVVGPKAKPLIWEVVPETNKDWHDAVTPFVTYRMRFIKKFPSGFAWAVGVRDPFYDFPNLYDDMSAAKAAAQADFERRILSSLTEGK